MESVAVVITVLASCFLVTSVGGAQTLRSAPVNPRYLQYRDAVMAGRAPRATPDGHGLGYIPPPFDHAGLRLKPRGERRMALPAAYDLRTIPGKLPDIRDQGPCGSCWTFGIYASLESCLRPGDTFDASENNMKNTHGGDWGHCDGGNQWLGTAYLARWSGPVAEASDPYSPASPTSPPGLPNQKQVQEVIFLPNRTGPLDNDAIKNAVMTYGAVTMAFYYDPGAYNAGTAAYYLASDLGSNHEVAIVGWDDNYSATSFASLPPGNGAFIVRNSWGIGWGESGYFYISYYDATLGYYDLSVFENAEDLPTSDVFTPFTKNYGYDPLGWCNDLGATQADTLWGANVFPSSGVEERLEAVSFYATAPNMSYEIYVYRNPTGDPITGGTLEATLTGSAVYAGYYTLALATPVTVLATDTCFSIVLKGTNPSYQWTQAFEDAYPGYSSAATAAPGQSYVSLDGATWWDLTAAWSPTANFCIKGFTNPSRPRLEWAGTTGYETDGVDPDTGDPIGGASPTTFTFKVKYTDPTGNNPLLARCVIQKKGSGTSWTDCSRTTMTLESGTIATGAIYACPMQLPDEVLKYRFLFQAADGSYVTGAPSVFQDGKPTVSGVPHLAWSGLTGFETDGVEPNSGPVGTKFKFQVKCMDSAGDAPAVAHLEVRRNGASYKTLDLVPWASGSDCLGRNYQRSLTFNKSGTYEYRYVFADASGNAVGDPTNWQSAPAITGVGAAIVTSVAAVPTAAGAQLTFSLAGAADVTATVVNLAGRPVKTIAADQPLEAGLQTLMWDGKADTGIAVPAGLYLIRVVARDADGGQSTALATVAVR